MPPLVFDFLAIASRLRKDDFFTPRKEETEEDTTIAASDRLKFDCTRCGSENTFQSNGLWYCHTCKSRFA